ncbi:hypothetical protein IV203_012553 [Nitzschia inconspicua]|uniref:Uncharacterized protein n=1 Tax=Nitzschia inconspicua TaxID=303405 RepID=A0A9K3KUZ5_9STRA|nr:hypothetical protein IV203_012553 [Nitzschia inconspicua]
MVLAVRLDVCKSFLDCEGKTKSGVSYCGRPQHVDRGSWEDKYILRLELEYRRMHKAHLVCPEEVMGVEEDGFAVFENGASLLLSDVGDHYSRLDPQSIMDSLKYLHQNRILHGDARLENVVCVNGKPCWIDFAESSFEFAPMSQAAECEQLRASILDRFRYNAL